MLDKEKDKMDGVEEKRDEGLPVGIGERISFLRRKAGLTQAQLAEQLGISAQAVSKWESGLSCPDIMMLLPLAGIFNVSTDVLLGGAAMENQENAASTAHVRSEAEAEAIKMVALAAKAIEEEKKERIEWHDKKSEDAGETISDERPCEEQKGERKSGQNEQSYKPPEEIHSLRLDLGVAEAFIRVGTEFSLTLTGYGAGDCNSTVSNGVWKISDRYQRDFIFVVGIRNFFRTRRAIITIPAGYHFKEVHLGMGAGTITGESITTDSCILDVGAGQITLTDLCSGESDLKCGMGEIKINGTLTGKCKMDCGMGCISANLTVLEEFGYDVNVGMGEVKIGEDGFAGIGGHHVVNRNMENFFRVNCGMGTVGIHFSPRR